MTTPVSDLEAHRVALTGHCYRMLGSVIDAEDAVQETMIRAFRALERFDGRSSLRTWLYRIATNVCLDALASRNRRARPMEDPEGTVDAPLVERPRTHWLEPVPDARALPSDADPSEQAIMRQSIRLAFVAALQHLPPKQRAALILTDVLGWTAAEIAECLETSVPAVNSALQRARATLASLDDVTASPTEMSARDTELLARYVDAFERYDVDALTLLLREDATFSMPPYALWLRGPSAVRAWLLGRGSKCRGSRLVATAANGSPAFGQYRAGEPGEPHTPWALIVLEVADGRIAGWNSFLDTATYFPLFGLPLELR